MHWEVSKRCGFDVSEKWYEHEPDAASENNDSKSYGIFEVQTDHVIESRRPDKIVKD